MVKYINFFPLWEWIPHRNSPLQCRLTSLIEMTSPSVPSIKFPPTIPHAESKSVTWQSQLWWMRQHVIFWIWNCQNLLSESERHRWLVVGRCQIVCLMMVSLALNFQSRFWWKLIDLALRARCQGPSRWAKVHKQFPTNWKQPMRLNPTWHEICSYVSSILKVG